MAGRYKSRGIILPLPLIEIHSKEPAVVIFEKRVHTDNMFPGQVIIDDLVG